MSFDVEAIRAQFPILSTQVHGKPLVYLDSGASSQKPEAVLDAMDHYYRHTHSNVHRGVHELSQLATEAYEATRTKVANWINAASEREVVFTRGTTEAINLVAQTFGLRLTAGDRILVSELEHHANLVPWQMLAQRSGAALVKIPVMPNGELDQSVYRAELAKGAALVAICAVSNALGTRIPVKDMCAQARAAGAVTLVDGAQAVPHDRVDVQALGCDFYAFSSHKMYGPTGIGVLYGREAVLETLPPWQGGGDMIDHVTFESSTYNVLPYRLEAGTPSIAEGIGLGAAIDWLHSFDFDAAAAHEQALYDYARTELAAIDGLRLIGTAGAACGAISFEIAGIAASDLGTLLDQQGIAVRTGHHCAMPALQAMGVNGTTRASLGIYNTRGDIDALVAGIDVAMGILL
ncbi:SufS family cysteine desulfurase [Litorivicinus lipolyticus]|uniref:Cysteine desulfurase n=1 Tax=Litorivicinus lipolyticus TaxID=418701 RepID=A0A5Q2QFP2_9GAMM|nr:SufS family cysteine desulfurase [Litorivicinus lipolyticus]QGG81191.1 SufS family cysteine desulfurase [Litorivicinus lipolyticus]